MWGRKGDFAFVIVDSAQSPPPPTLSFRLLGARGMATWPLLSHVYSVCLNPNILYLLVAPFSSNVGIQTTSLFTHVATQVCKTTGKKNPLQKEERRQNR